MKYYVVSGELRRIVIADSTLSACEKALNSAKGETIGTYFYVDERGFRDKASMVAFSIHFKDLFVAMEKPSSNSWNDDEYFDDFDDQDFDSV